MFNFTEVGAQVWIPKECCWEGKELGCGTAKDTDDPIEQKKAKKKEAVAKNELQRLRNLSARMMKSKSKAKINLEPTDRPTAEQLNRSVFIGNEL